jgi:hypothetical protein
MSFVLEAAKNGHIEILKVLKDFMSLNYCSLKTGLTALHISSYYGQTDFSREIFAFVAANVITEKPDGNQKLGEIKLEVGSYTIAFCHPNESTLLVFFSSPVLLLFTSLRHLVMKVKENEEPVLSYSFDISAYFLLIRVNSFTLEFTKCCGRCIFSQN